MKTSEMPDRASPISKHDYLQDRIYLRSDSFGLGHFVASSDLSVEVGDLVQIDRVLYTEWALYVGDGNVAHICNLESENEIPMDFATMKLSKLVDVAGIGGVRVNNKIVGAKDRNLESLAVEQVIQNACDLVDKVVEFNMLTRNSEHYVTEWKYGQGWSDQTAMTMNVMRTVSMDTALGQTVLVNSLNAVLNSPGSPISRSPPKFPTTTNNEESSKS